MTFEEFKYEFESLLEFTRGRMMEDGSFCSVAVFFGDKDPKLGMMALSDHPHQLWPQLVASAVRHQRAQAAIYSIDTWYAEVPIAECDENKMIRARDRPDCREALVIRGRHAEYGKWALIQFYSRDGQNKPLFAPPHWRQINVANRVLDDLQLVPTAAAVPLGDSR